MTWFFQGRDQRATVVMVNPRQRRVLLKLDNVTKRMYRDYNVASVRPLDPIEALAELVT